MSRPLWRALIVPLIAGAIASMAILAVIYYVFPGVAYAAAMRAERALAGLTTHEVTITDGMRIVYTEGGQGEPLLLLHGFTADKDNWTRVARFLTGEMHVIAPDLPGFGDSSRDPTLDYSIEHQLQWLEAFVSAIGLQRFHIGGSSMGGNLAAVYAATHPDRVRSLWLLAPAGVQTPERSEMEQRLARGEAHPLIPASRAEFAATLDFVFTTTPFLPAAIRRHLAREAARRAPLNRAIFSQLLDPGGERFEPILNPTVRGLATPTLVIWGQNDRVLHPAGAVALQSLLPDARAIVLPDTGHLPMLEKPEVVARLYLDFVAGR